MPRLPLCLLASALCAAPAFAQSDAGSGDDAPLRIILFHSNPLPEDRITVLATGRAERLDWTGDQVSVFDRADIEAVQGPDITRLLERVPGVAITRNGPLGAFTGVRVRGAEAEQLLVLVDGVRLADTAAPSGGFDFGTLAMGNLAKVELQRGSNATIWGSDAIGGVLLASTLVTDDGLDGAVEYGTDDTLYASGGAGLVRGPAALSLRGGYLRSDGFSAAASGTEPDGFRQYEANGAADIELAGGLTAFARARYADGRAEFDGFPAPAFALADTGDIQHTSQLSGAAGLRYLAEGVDLLAAWSQADTERENFDPATGPAPTFTADGTSRRAELRGRVRVAGSWSANLGAEREWTGFATLFDPRRETAIWGAYAQADYDADALHVAIGLRRDEHRDFGGAWSFGADASLDLTDRLRATASYGEGFKAPSLFQLLSDFGNRALAPERSRSYDAGLAYDAGPVSASVIAFRRDTSDLIGFVSCFGRSDAICAGRPFGTYDNTARARAQGIEAEARAALADTLSLGLAYAHVDAENRATGLPLARRPGHALTLFADLEPFERLTLGADLRAVSHSFDDAAASVRLGGYATLALRGEYRLDEAVTLFGRIENLWDEDYQTAAGYATRGRAAFVGLRAGL